MQYSKRHQDVSGYWHTQTTLARWCRIRSYLDSAHGLTALEAVTGALAGRALATRSRRGLSSHP